MIAAPLERPDVASASSDANVFPRTPMRTAPIVGANLVPFPETAADLASKPRAFTTRRIPEAWIGHLVEDAVPRAGDLVFARIQALGQHSKLHLPDGRRRQLFVGDELIVAYGNRYASDQYEARVPDSLRPCHLAAGAGLAGLATKQHREMRQATAIVPIGLIARNGETTPVNVRDAALPLLPRPAARTVPTIGVVGTSMNSGKTTSAAFLARGLRRAGFRVGYVKATGTSASGDPGLLGDAGAEVTLDCVDAGYVSTYLVPIEEIERGFLNLLAHVQRTGVDVIFVEIADGLLQQETAAFLESEISRTHFDGTLFAAADAMGAAMGSAWLAGRGHRVLAVTGTLTSAPLQIQEAAAATGLPVRRTQELSAPAEAAALISALRRTS